MESIESIASDITETVDKCLEQFRDIKAEIIKSINKFKLNINQQSNENFFYRIYDGKC